MSQTSDRARRLLASDRDGARFKACVDAIADGVIVIDADGLIEEFNDAAAQMFGYTQEEIIGRNVSLLMADEDQAGHDGYMERYRRTRRQRIIGVGREVVARRRDGSVFPVYLRVGEASGGAGPSYVGIVRDLRAEKDAERALDKERNRAESYLDLAEVMLLALDTAGAITMINRKGAQILGYDATALVGRNWFEQCIPERERDSVRTVFRTLVQDGRDESFAAYHENSVRTRDGRERLIAWRNRPTRDDSGRIVGTLSSGEDITVRRASEQALKRSEAMLHAAQEIASIGNYEVHIPPRPDDFVSAQAHKILGLPAPLALAASRRLFAEMVHPDDRDDYERLVRQAIEAVEDIDVEVRFIRPSGEVRIVHVVTQVTRGNGNVRLFGILHDVTGRRHAEEDARQARERLTHVSRVSTMGEMAAGLAHELNQPLTAISAYAQACQRMFTRSGAVQEPDLGAALEQIAAQALRAGDVIARLRNFVKRHHAERETIDCNSIVEDLVTLARPDARAADVDLRIELQDQLPPVHVDVVQIQQVILNLVRNAIDATMEVEDPDASVVIRTHREENGDVRVAVVDEGSGLAPGAEDRLFTPFFTTKSAGTGLGLPISQSIVRAHGGRMGFSRNAGPGSTFWFSLPAFSGEPS